MTTAQTSSQSTPFPRSSIGTPPTGTGLAAPASIAPGEPARLTVAVMPGQFPIAGGISVSADLGPRSAGPRDSRSLTTARTAMPRPATTSSRRRSRAAWAPRPPVRVSVLAILTDALARQSTTTITVAVEALRERRSRRSRGPGPVSPLAGQFVTTAGVVIGVKPNGFFVQTPDDAVDADPMTSEGIFIFTGGIPSAAAASGNLVRVSGTVTEFVPAADVASPPVTQVGGGLTPPVAVRLLAAGSPLPAPTMLTPADTSPGGTIEQLERFEGMRAAVDALRVIAPTQAAFIDEPAAISVSNGVFYGVIDGRGAAAP